MIPHAKWHAQTAAALSDMTRLMDFVLELENRHRDDGGQVRVTRKKNNRNYEQIEEYLRMSVSIVKKYRKRNAGNKTKIHCLSH